MQNFQSLHTHTLTPERERERRSVCRVCAREGYTDGGGSVDIHRYRSGHRKRRRATRYREVSEIEAPGE